MRLRNLSLVGMLASVDGSITHGAACKLELLLDGATIDLAGAVVRTSPCEVALRFTELPFESFERLRQVLIASAVDPARVAEEINDGLGHLGECA